MADLRGEGDRAGDGTGTTADARAGSEERSPGSVGGRGPALLKLALLVALLVGALVAVRVTPLGDLLSREGIDRAVRWLRGSTWAPVTFIGVYTGAMALALPGSVLTLAGGALFGLFWGVVYNSIAANLGANLAFLLARWLGRDGVERLFGDRLEKLDRATREHGFKGLLTLRLIPLVPFNALNFGSGLTAMRWSTYALATAIGILPGTIVYTMFADALLEGSREASRAAFVRVAVSGALLILLAFLPQILKKMKISLPGTASRLVASLALPLALLTGSLGAAPAPGQAPAEGAPALDLPAILQEIPDHGRFTDLLRDVVVGSRVDYALLVERRDALDAYLRELAGTDSAVLGRAPDPVRLAFWINAYNACMLELVAEHYPIERSGSLLDRIRNAVADRPRNSVWQIEDVFTRRHCTVAGRARSQDEIEHEIIRPLGEPRIHFAVNCAAVSCPPLRDEAYVPERLNAQLDAAVRSFIGSSLHFRADHGTLHLNRVLEWYGEDFGGEAGIRRFLAGYLDGEVRAFVLDPGTEIAYLPYDWTLNDVER